MSEVHATLHTTITYYGLELSRNRGIAFSSFVYVDLCIIVSAHHILCNKPIQTFFFSRTAALLLYALKAAVTSDFKAALCPSPLSVRRGEVVCFIATHSSPHCSNVEVVIGLQRFPTCYHVTYCSIQLHKCRIIHSFACNYTK